jgi:predicted signal transduction protein with EAL and GGDEF domain
MCRHDATRQAHSIFNSSLEARLDIATESQDKDNIAALRAQVTAQQLELEALRSQLADLIRHDPLTGVMNRRTLVEMLGAELQRSHRTGHPFCFAMLNIDHFKAINEQYGTPAGGCWTASAAWKATASASCCRPPGSTAASSP